MKPSQSVVGRLFFFVLVIASCSNETETISQARMQDAKELPTVLCLDNGVFDVRAAQKVRDELGDRNLKGERLLDIASALDSAASECVSAESRPNVEILGAIYVSLGNRLLTDKDFQTASQVFEDADHYYAKYAFPSLMWLEALRGLARAETRLGEFRAAATAASKQTDLARSWVNREGFVRDALVDALRFEAEVSAAQRQTDRAEQLLSEAAQLDSGQ